jgi:AP-4 complex subunit beta-1
MILNLKRRLMWKRRERKTNKIRNGLTDGSAYVRKTAVMGVAKLFSIAPTMVRDSDLVDILYNMIRDKDSLVVINSIHALNEILVEEGGMAVNVKIVHHLLNKLHTFNEWSQCTVLEVVSRYTPSGSNARNEVFDIMNLLEDRLRHSNSALVFATAKEYLRLTVYNVEFECIFSFFSSNKYRFC